LASYRIKSIILRLVMDVTIVSIALLFSTFLYFFFLLNHFFAAWTSFSVTQSAREILNVLLNGYAWSVGPIVAVHVLTFHFFGFYTHGAYYRRNMAFVIFCAVTLAYISTGSLYYLVDFALFKRSMEAFNIDVFKMNRAVFLLSFPMVVASVLGVRISASLWRQTVIADADRYRMHAKVKKVLVFGGAGYVGSLLCRKLLEHRYEVFAYDLLFYGDHGISDLYRNPNFNFVKADSRDIVSVIKEMKKVDAVVHLGEIVGDPACAFDAELTGEVNYLATKMVAEAAKGMGLNRFIYVSSCSVYGDSDSSIINEKSALKPVSLYARAKVEAEKAVLSLSDVSFSPTILRFASLYGVSPRMRFDLIVNIMVANAMTEKKILIEGGNRWRPFLHVADAAESILACLRTPILKVAGEVFNVGNDAENFQLKGIGEIIRDVIPNVSLTTRESQDRISYQVSFKKFSKRLGFRPARTVRFGIQEVMENIKTHNIINFKQDQYINSEMIRSSEHKQSPMKPVFN